MKETSNNFLSNNKQYACKDPYKVCLLRCMGAKIISRDATDPQNIVFVLEHNDIAAWVDAIHTGTVGQYLKEGANKYMEYHKEIMGYIRDVRTNRGGR